MERNTAFKFAKERLIFHGLSDWKVRISNEPNSGYLGLCMFDDKTIVLNAYHIELHPDAEVEDTILHEIAHALVGKNHGHDLIWAMKAQELGARSEPCNHFSLPPHVIDAIRSSQTVEIIEEEITIKVPKYKVTQLKDTCPECGKVAKEMFSITSVDADGNDVKLITLECFHIMKKIIPRATPYETMVSNDWKPEIKNCKHDWPTKAEVGEPLYLVPNQCKKCGEFKLFDFQVVGARACENGLSTQKGFGIFDDMGLGKTVQGLAVIKFHPNEFTPTLYVVKSAITFNWLKQILRWLGPEYLGQIIKSGRDAIIPGLKSYIVSYDLLRRIPKEKIAKLGIKCIVLDECQQIKNPDSTRTKEVRALVSQPNMRVIPLSGTPWKNRGSEFFAVLNMIDPVKFYSYQHYLDTWVDYYWEGAKRKMGGIRNIPKFREFTQSLLIRREFDEVIDNFPSVNRMKLDVQLDAMSQSTYDDSVSDFVAWYNEAVIGGEEDALNGMEILAKMSRMRHITGLAKIPATLGFIEEFIEDTDRKLVVFVHHKDVGELMIDSLTTTNKDHDWYELAQALRDAKIPVMKLTAEFSDGERYTIGETFNRHPRAILIASTLASGEGIDLQTCCDSVLHERQWNPQNEDQATPGRFKRIGQKSKVINITFTEAEGTIDEDLDYIVGNKRGQFHAAMNKSEMPVWNESDFARQLAEVIVNKFNARNKTKVPEGTKVKSLTSQASL